MTTDLIRADVVRSTQLDDIEIERGGDGRTVTAYATPFETDHEIRDQHGHYWERFSRRSFDKTAQEATRSGVIVLYNHGMDLRGESHGPFMVPIGRPVEIVPDGHGLLTRTEFYRTQLADDILDAIRAGAVSAYSHTSQVLRSRRAGERDGLPLFEHQEVRLREYGPTPIPQVKDGGARIVAVRSDTLAERLRQVDADDLDSWDPLLRDQLARMLQPKTTSLSSQPPSDEGGDNKADPPPEGDEDPEPQGPDLDLLAAAQAARRRR